MPEDTSSSTTTVIPEEIMSDNNNNQIRVGAIFMGNFERRLNIETLQYEYLLRMDFVNVREQWVTQRWLRWQFRLAAFYERQPPNNRQ